eukprot:3715296-Amphidinium_carterae.1
MNSPHRSSFHTLALFQSVNRANLGPRHQLSSALVASVGSCHQNDKPLQYFLRRMGPVKLDCELHVILYITARDCVQRKAHLEWSCAKEGRYVKMVKLIHENQKSSLKTKEAKRTTSSRGSGTFIYGIFCCPMQKCPPRSVHSSAAATPAREKTKRTPVAPAL